MTHSPRPDLLVGALAVVLALGCAWTARRAEPAVESALFGPASVARGERVFMTQCQQCHPGGEGGFAQSLNDKVLPPALIRLQVRRGLGAMPAFPRAQLSEADLDDLVAFVIALRQRSLHH